MTLRANIVKLLAALILLALLAPASALANQLIANGDFSGDDSFILTLAHPVDQDWDWHNNVYVHERQNPDINMAIKTVDFSNDRTTLTITLDAQLSTSESYIVGLKNVPVRGQIITDANVMVSQSTIALLIGIIITFSLIQNFVFSKYLGLCIFFGTSARKETAVGMGASFLFVVICSAVAVWAVYNFVLLPFNLGFLQVLTFVGCIAVFVQFLDTVLRKINPYLFKKLGVYLVLITTNCIILAVPLLLVSNAYDLWESLALSVGTGIGFFIALFLMACVRERLDLADVPEVFRGLPIAFIVAGLFALAFLGFTGMS